MLTSPVLLRRTAAALLAGAAVLWSASPAGAHHDPDQLRAAEAAAEALPVDAASGGGIPLGVVVAATVALAVVFLARAGLPRLRPRRAIAIVSAAALVSVPLATAQAATQAILLPDLISDQPDPVSLEVNSYTGTPRLVLRFDGYVTNVGDGPLEVSGNPQITDSSNPSAVHQRAIDSTGTWHIVATPLVQYETADSHNHFHLMEVGRYSLWNESKTAEAAPGQKVGFCLYDIEHAESEDWSGSHPSREYTGSVTQFCDSNNPNTTSLIMGTSEGWRDVYGAYLTFQWVDVSETAPGIYYLANEADPHNRIVESDETNNQIGFAEVASTIPGYNALPVGPVSTVENTAVGVTLESESFGSPGSRRFEIVTAPAHGSLSRSVGASFSSPNVTYTPDPGYNGPDSFEYIARDNSSAYPLNPTIASVSLDVGAALDPAVEISGAPASLIAGTSAQLTATVTDAPDGVSWSVDGVGGGNSTVGTITTGGLYVAPASPPPGDDVIVRATLDDDPSIHDEVTITIDPVPNNAPVMVDPGDQASTIGDAVNLPIGATDPDGDPFTFAATGLPTGTSIHPTTGVITGTVTTTGTFPVTVTTDDGTDTADVDFDWIIDPRPEIRPGVVAVWEGDAGSQVVSLPLTLSEPVSQPVTVDWTVHDGAAPLASVGSDIGAGSGTATFAPGTTTTSIDITVHGDTADEPPAWLGEWGVVVHSSPSPNADLWPGFWGLGVVIIADDD
ncbi:MAG: lysyl oxidase family protein [Acidimicrobiales bacterium]|nr:lysyl oxidase family protein [Acidimicrobiales bacterium]